MKSVVQAGLALLAMSPFPAASEAATFDFSFGGPGVAGTLVLTYEADTKTGSLPSIPPNSVDPVGSFVITNVSGIFSDSNIGASNVAVVGLVPLNRVAPERTNTDAPYSFSLFPVAGGIDAGVPSAGLHYDNLFYPGGSPQTAADYPFRGGVFDIYGLAFRLSGGTVVNLWSNGIVPVTGLDYGVAVATDADLLDYTGGVSVSAVPLPASAPLFGGALLALACFGYSLDRWVAPKPEAAA